MPNWLSSAYSTATRPLVPKGAIEGLQQGLDPGGSDPSGGFIDAAKGIPDVARGIWQHPRETLGGMGAGMLEGARQQTSPLGLANIASTASGVGGMVRAAGAARAAKAAGMMEGLPAGATGSTFRGKMGDLDLYDVVGGPSHGSTISRASSPAVKGLEEAAQKAPFEPFDPKVAYQEYNQSKIAADMAKRDAMRGTAADVAHSPEAQALEKLRESGPIHWGPEHAATQPQASSLATQSARDIMNPKSLDTMDRMFQESNPVFRRMQEAGQFNRGNVPQSGVGLWSKNQPKPGGVLSQVLERGAMKGAIGETPTPGEAQLLKHYAKMIR